MTTSDTAGGLAPRDLFRATKDKPKRVTFLPDPEVRHRHFPIISADDHIVEPAHVFDGRVPARFVDRAPRIVEGDDGVQIWHYDGTAYPDIGLNAVVGRPIEEATFDPKRFDEMRAGAWDIRARVRDMDINGVWASLCFPSGLPGFAGQRLQLGREPELARAVVRAWNDWHIEEWCGTFPDRMIPCQIPWLLDPVEAAAEIRANAERGFKAVAFSESPEKLGLPSLHTGYWDPFLAACEETDTVVCLHVGSSSTVPTTAPDAPPDVIGVLFFGHAMFAAVDWLYSRIPVRFPNIKVCLSEGGIAWVAGLLDRLDHVGRYQSLYGTWSVDEPSPAEVFQRNFWFSAIEDPSNFQLRHRIGIDHLLVESDYPHLDTTWPDTQEVVWDAIGSFPEDEVRKIAWENAAALFRHPLPESVVADPNAGF